MKQFSPIDIIHLLQGMPSTANCTKVGTQRWRWGTFPPTERFRPSQHTYTSAETHWTSQGSLEFEALLGLPERDTTLKCVVRQHYTNVGFQMPPIGGTSSQEKLSALRRAGVWSEQHVRKWLCDIFMASTYRQDFLNVAAILPVGILIRQSNNTFLL